jgi:hypothetical protein
MVVIIESVLSPICLPKASAANTLTEDYNALFALIDNHIPHVVLIGQSAKELGNNIHTAKVTYANSMEAAVNIALTQSLNTRPRCSKSSNISKLAQAGDSKIAPLSIKILAILTAASIELA